MRTKIWILLAVLAAVLAVASTALSADAPTSHADFYWDEAAPAPNVAVHFHGTAFSETDGVSPTAYHWTFGDGATADGTDPVHTYTASDSYDVALTVDFSDGTTGSSTQSVQVAPLPDPNADFSFSPTDPRPEVPVAFQASADDPYGGTTATSYAWDFGDGHQGTGEAPSHTYAQAGDYTATLTVTFSDARTGTASYPVSVTQHNDPPDGYLYADPDSPRVGAPVDFHLTVTDDAPVSQLTYAWDFDGDGTVDATTKPDANGVVRFAAGYADTSEHTAKVTVTDGDGASTDLTAAVAAHTGNQAPYTDIAWSPDTPRVNEAVTFKPVGTIDDEPVADLHYLWTFGDGATSTQASPSHAYASAGDEAVTLKVTDADNASFTATATVTVAPGNTAPDAVIGNDPVDPRLGEPVAFTASATDDRDASDQLTYLWHFGADATPQTSTDPAPTGVRFGTGGPHHVTLDVTDTENATGHAALDLDVSTENDPPSVDFAPPEDAQANHTAYFSADATDDRQVVAYHWDFGDPGSGTDDHSGLQSPGHTYSAPGDYVVSVYVTDNEGADSPVVKHVLTVGDHPPEASFKYAATAPAFDPAYPQLGDGVTLTSTSTGGQGTLHYAWDLNNDGDFSDATGPTVKVPSSAFPDAGAYSFTLQVTDDAGQSDMQWQTVVVVPKSRFGGPQIPEIRAPTGDRVPVSVAPNPDGTFAVTVPFGHGDVVGLSNFPDSCMPMPMRVPIAHSASEQITAATLDFAPNDGDEVVRDMSRTDAGATRDVFGATVPCYASGVVDVTATIVNTRTGRTRVVRQASRVTKPCIRLEDGSRACLDPIDPSGTIYDRAKFNAARARGESADDARADAAVTGATVTLQQRLADNTFGDVPASDPRIDPKQNPQTSDDFGHYGWNVGGGVWRVKVSAPGYRTTYSEPRVIPPAVDDLDVALDPNAAPQVGALQVSDAAPATGEAVKLSATAQDLDGNAVKVEWDGNGDGRFSGAGDPPAGPGPVTVSFASPGTYTVRVRATDADGLSTVRIAQVVVHAPASSGGGGSTGGGGTPPPSGGGGTPPAGDHTAPVISLKVAKRVKARVLRRGLAITIRTSEACRVKVALRLGKLAAGGLSRSLATGATKVKVKLSRKALKRVRRGTTLTVRVAATDAAGNATIKTVKVRVT